jgi:hypothetical protein
MKPVRVQRKREKGWKMPANTVYVGRPSRWGNPFRIGEEVDQAAVRGWEWKFRSPRHVCKDAQEAVRKFAGCLGLDDCMIAEVRRELKGKNLACFCPLDHPCHADVLLEIANSEGK